MCEGKIIKNYEEAKCAKAKEFRIIWRPNVQRQKN